MSFECGRGLILSPHAQLPHAERAGGICVPHAVTPYALAPILRYGWNRGTNAAGNPLWRNLGALGSAGDATGPGGAADPTACTGGRPGYTFTSASSQYLSLPAGTILSAARPFTVRAWVRCASLAAGTYPTILTFQTAGASGWKILCTTDAAYGAISFGEPGVGALGRYRANTYPTANLTSATRHLLITYNGAGGTTIGNYAIYVDGVAWPLAASGAFGGIANSSRIGRDTTGGFFWSGDIYAVEVHQAHFSADLVRHLFESERRQYGV